MEATPLNESYFDVGRHHRTITTNSPECQTWFNRALTWFFAFDFDESVFAAEKAIEHDPFCPMAHWVLVICLGPSLSKSWKITPPAWLMDDLANIRQSMAVIQGHSEAGCQVEKDLCEAVMSIIPTNTGDKKFAEWEKAYCEAMETVLEKYPDDLDIVAIAVQAIMCSPRGYRWDIKTGEPKPGSRAPYVKQLLEQAMKQDGGRRHPGINHFYIHLMETSATPELAISSSNRLFDLVPHSTHLRHMPAHIDTVIGDYRRAILAGSAAVANDSRYAQTRAPTRWAFVVQLHNLHYTIFAAMSMGNFAIAMENVNRLNQLLTLDGMRQFGTIMEMFTSVEIHVLVRFGKWREILQKPIPQDAEMFTFTIIHQHYARGIAYSALGDIKAAEEERSHFTLAMARVSKEKDELYYGNKGTTILKIGEAMLDGEIEYRKGNYEVAFQHLRTSIERYDALGYAEPPSWMQPVRHAYAALKLEQDHVQEALEAYADDLGLTDVVPRVYQHPNNVWALHGYHEALLKLGRHEEARGVELQLRVALAMSDIPIHSSCFCRKDKKKLANTA